MNLKPNRLFTPGPTPVPEFILRKMSEPIIHHRKAEFIQIFQETRHGLSDIFQTRQEVYILTTSGTGAMEASVVSFLSPGDEVITVDGGKFGERWADLCQTYGVVPHVIKKEWGTAVAAGEIVEKLQEVPAAKAVFLTYSETSTGVAIDLPEIARAIRAQSSALIVVDCISALVAMPLKMDAWDLDVVISASQKGFMLPPGLGLVAVSERAAQLLKSSKIPNYYLSLLKAQKAVLDGTTPFTPASTIIIGLNEAIHYLKLKGLENVWREHAVFAAAVRAAVQAVGFKLLTESPSNAVTAVCLPENLDGKKLVQTLQNQFGIIVAGGQGHLKNKIIRIGHIGYYDALEIISFIAAFEWSLKITGWDFEQGSGLSAANAVLQQLFC
jgi:aspartate aminotransferase-like enzyme